MNSLPFRREPVYLKTMTEDGSKIFTVVLDKEESDKLEDIVNTYKDNRPKLLQLIKDHTQLETSNILIFGNTSDVKESSLKKFIEYEYIALRETKLGIAGGFTLENSRNYDCFTVRKYNPLATRLIMHEDIKSSWLCLLEKLGQPEYLFIYKEK